MFGIDLAIDVFLVESVSWKASGKVSVCQVDFLCGPDHGLVACMNQPLFFALETHGEAETEKSVEDARQIFRGHDLDL